MMVIAKLSERNAQEYNRSTSFNILPTVAQKVGENAGHVLLNDYNIT